MYSSSFSYSMGPYVPLHAASVGYSSSGFTPSDFYRAREPMMWVDDTHGHAGHHH